MDGLTVQEELEDVETLNQWAAEGRLEMTKVSYHAYFHVCDRYLALRSGGALGRGVGPLLVRGESSNNSPLVATPGPWTTAHLLLQLARPDLGPLVCMRYDQIIPAIQNGRVGAGVLIHESRFLLDQYGLEPLLDLGQWWESETDLPLPLGAILARRDLGSERLQQLQRGVRRSLELAREHPERSRQYIRQHANELSDEIIDRHIATFVNDYSLDVESDGEAAVYELRRRAVEAGLLKPDDSPLFVE